MTGEVLHSGFPQAKARTQPCCTHQQLRLGGGCSSGRAERGRVRRRSRRKGLRALLKVIKLAVFGPGHACHLCNFAVHFEALGFVGFRAFADQLQR